METHDWVPGHGEELSQSIASVADFTTTLPVLPDDECPCLTDSVDLGLSPEDLEDAFAIARMGVWRWRVGTADFAWSRELYRIAGRNPAIFVPTLENTLACIHPDDREHIRTRLMGAVDSFDPLGREFRIARPEGANDTASHASVLSPATGT